MSDHESDLGTGCVKLLQTYGADVVVGEQDVAHVPGGSYSAWRRMDSITYNGRRRTSL